MNYNQDAMRRIAQTVQRKEHGQKPSGPDARGPRNVMPSYEFRVTQAVGGMQGATPGKGKGTRQNFDGTSYSDSTDTNIALFNDNEKGIKVGSYVKCSFMHGGWHIDHNDKCSNLV